MRCGRVRRIWSVGRSKRGSGYAAVWWGSSCVRGVVGGGRVVGAVATTNVYYATRITTYRSP